MFRACSIARLIAPPSAVLALATMAGAQCPTIDFEDLPAGTPVSSQYPGVVFSNAFANPPRIVNFATIDPPGVTTSGTHVLAVGDPAVDIDCGFLRMQFSNGQREVEFSLGVAVGCSANETVEVRVFDTFGNILPFQNVPVNGLRRNLCNALVRVGSPTGPRNIGTIEVHAHAPGGCDCRIEMIDDLVYNIDHSAPIADLQHPTEGDACSCTPISFTGVSYDPDGTYASDTLERSTSLRGPWTLVGSFFGTQVGPVPGPLYTDDTAALADGYYYYRLTTRNTCGLAADSYTRVYVDNSPPTIGFSNLPDSTIVRGDLCFYGSLLDACGVQYTVEYKPFTASDGAYQPVDPASALYTAQVDRGNFARWDTVLSPSNPVGVADGTYRVRISASDPCAHNSTLSFKYTVDNTAPVAVITSPADCTLQPGDPLIITGTIADVHLAAWSIDVLGGPYTTWHTLISDRTGENRSGNLFAWDRSGLPDCFYAIRLTAVDKATDGCDSGGNTTVAYALFDGQHCHADFNRDGLLDPDDLSDYISAYFAGCP